MTGIRTDVVVAGAGFAGLACATELAKRGIAVTLLERKKTPGTALHTTGILVREAAELLKPPEHLVRKISEVRLYSPSLSSLRLRARDYFFLATDTAALLRHMTTQAQQAGVDIRFDSGFMGARSQGNGFSLPAQGLRCRFLIGADGARSRVAAALNLGRNRHFLAGSEAEFEGIADGEAGEALHCFLSRRYAPGYLGWAVPGLGVTQAGLAASAPHHPALNAFLHYVQTSPAGEALGLSKRRLLGHRGGLIPAGGPVYPLSRGNALLTGDAAGIVSPLTGGGIHTALHHGALLGRAIADHLLEGAPHPGLSLPRVYPAFRFKRLLRLAHERLSADWLMDASIGSPLFRLLAETVFFRPNRLKTAGLHQNCTENRAKNPPRVTEDAYVPASMEETAIQIQESHP
jgi:flavin-dependent dehydrogenase